ncbi:MAG: hypothetical protein NZM04_05585 [Methylacidiphilales bacterium]|nr:hypothetical protein [Candidatus Methylacidiphilales bacterium]
MENIQHILNNNGLFIAIGLFVIAIILAIYRGIFGGAVFGIVGLGTMLLLEANIYGGLISTHNEYSKSGMYILNEGSKILMQHELMIACAAVFTLLVFIWPQREN